ncbi:MAG: alpha-L-rhamnosidase C-terminal domain-containing protein, partial [Bacteroidaceae bacterium]|nr:alpha-L-rhamnosidase C-terminal domain-containing protein [Bacteroidaceae bacterium]
WFHQALAGITPDESQPGYKHINIRPQLVEGITWVKATKDSSYGPIAVNWNREEKEFTLDVEIPAGCTATVTLPAGAKDIVVDAQEGEVQGETVSLPSGTYQIACLLASE